MSAPFAPGSDDPGIQAEQAGKDRANAEIAAGKLTDEQLRAVLAFFKRPKGGATAHQWGYLTTLRDHAKARGLDV